ncbi:penicillin-binding protein 1A [Thiopseudomonas alkaliphila]
MIKLLKFLFWSIAGALSSLAALFAGAYLYLSPHLPSAESLRSMELQMPLRIYSKDNKLIAEYGEMRRTPIDFGHIPERFIQALLAAEDDNFATHSGVDFVSLMRAVSELIKTGRIQSGGSTITMQVAKNFFLTSEKSFTRKANEILLALQIERELSKDEILELYVNKIYLGNRAYGIEAAAQIYYGKSIGELSIAQLAMIAGLPKAPSRYNPIANEARSMIRRDWILGRMYKLNYITEAEYSTALAEPQTAKLHIAQPEFQAPYVAEMARAEMVERYGGEAYTAGFTVKTTIDSQLQQYANSSLQTGLLNYEYRHGFRGPVKSFAKYPEEQWQKLLHNEPDLHPLKIAVVTKVDQQSAQVLLRNKVAATLNWQDMRWARKFINVNSQAANPRTARDIIQPGDLVYVQQKTDGQYRLAQAPEVQGALVSLDPRSGAIVAITGGFSFEQSKYNRAVQAKRQVGSSFKPFIYSAALDKGYTAASIFSDTPTTFPASRYGKAWTPNNSDRSFLGNISLRTALYRSRNIAAAKVLEAIGIDYAVDYISQFGFPADELPRHLPLALGSADFTPLEVTTGWATFANGGYKITPYIVDEIYDRNGVLVSKTQAAVTPDSPRYQTDNAQPAPQIIDSRTAFIMTDILQDVIRRGTASRAKSLGRSDLAGKTGTTNSAKDTWFVGYNRQYVTTVWTGYDQPKSLGRREFGSTFALPIWINYMAQALRDQPAQPILRPEGLQQVRINAQGLRSDSGSNEYFKQEDSLPPFATEYYYETPMDFF